MIAKSGSDARSGATSFGRVAIEGRVDVTHGVILYLEDVSVSFDGFKALDALSLAIDDGELRCVIGPNGAGKTTMMDVITGKTRPDAGTRVLRAVDRPDAAVRAADRAGRHRPQVPEADGVRAAQRVGEPRARGQGRSALVEGARVAHAAETRGAGSTSCSRRSGSRKRSRDRRACSRTDRSSGSRSACCSHSSRACCCSTSRSPG